jgi:hypothetical protein
MTVRPRVILIALALQVSPSLLPAAHTQGWVEEACGYQEFHMTNVVGLPVGQELVLRVRDTPFPLAVRTMVASWWQARGQRCSSDGKCEDATQAEIWLNETKGRIKKVSGRYSVDFADQHLEGQFVVKYRDMKPPPRCE